MFRTTLSLAIAAVATAAFTSAASAGCYSCYTPPPQPCTTCYQVQTVPPQYRTVQEMRDLGAAQGNYPKAIHVYHQLMLSFPERLAFEQTL